MEALEGELARSRPNRAALLNAALLHGSLRKVAPRAALDADAEFAPHAALYVRAEQYRSALQQLRPALVALALRRRLRCDRLLARSALKNRPAVPGRALPQMRGDVEARGFARLHVVFSDHALHATCPSDIVVRRNGVAEGGNGRRTEINHVCAGRC